MSTIRKMLRGMQNDPSSESDEEVNIHHLPLERDAQPTRPQRTEPWPFGASPARQAQEAIDTLREHYPEIVREPVPPPAPAPHPLLPPEILHEVTVAKEMFAELLKLDVEARKRIMAMVDLNLQLYAPPPAAPAAPDVQGAPV